MLKVRLATIYRYTKLSIFFEGVKSEIKSPGLDDSEVAAALSAHQDVVTATAPFYGASPADIGAATYDKDYPQAYAQAHQYYNR